MTTRSKRLVWVFNEAGHVYSGPHLDEHPEHHTAGSDRFVVAVPCEVVQPAKPAKAAKPAEPAGD